MTRSEASRADDNDPTVMAVGGRRSKFTAVDLSNVSKVLGPSCTTMGLHTRCATDSQAGWLGRAREQHVRLLFSRGSPFRINETSARLSGGRLSFAFFSRRPRLIGGECSEFIQQLCLSVDCVRSEDRRVSGGRTEKTPSHTRP